MRGLSFGFGLSAGGASLIQVPAPLAVIVDDIRESLATGWVGAGWGATGLTTDESTYDDYLAQGGFALRTRSDASNGQHNVAKVLASVTSGKLHYADLVVKPEGRPFILLQVYTATQNIIALVDVENKTLGINSVISDWSVTDLSNGWKHLRMEFTPSTNESYICGIYHALDGSTFSMAGDTGKGLLIDSFVLSREA